MEEKKSSKNNIRRIRIISESELIRLLDPKYLYLNPFNRMNTEFEEEDEENENIYA